jgi:hypothetical protein
MFKYTDNFVDIMVAIAFIILGIFIVKESATIPDSPFEVSVGPAFVPRATGWTLILLAGILLAINIYTLRIAQSNSVHIESFSGFVLAVLSFFLIVAYVASMTIGIFGFRTATLIFITVLSWLLNRFRLKTLPLAILIGIIMAFGNHYFFTQIFIVDLP